MSIHYIHLSETSRYHGRSMGRTKLQRDVVLLVCDVVLLLMSSGSIVVPFFGVPPLHLVCGFDTPE